jgi:type IV fimbrial biogenesis protein FimT
MLGPLMRRQRGLTLVELMVVVAVVAVIAVIAAPAFGDLILKQRLRSINAQLVTDLQFARTEAVARNELMRVRFQSNTAMTCYQIYTSPANNVRCDCLLGPGAACSAAAGTTEVRTVQVPRSLSVRIGVPAGSPASFAFSPVNGAIQSTPLDSLGVPILAFVTDTTIDTARSLRTIVSGAGRPTVCAATGSTMPVPACPP